MFLDARRLVPIFAVNYQRALYQHAHKTLIQKKNMVPKNKKKMDEQSEKHKQTSEM